MTYMLCKHRVADFSRWHKVFASHTEAQKRAGLHLLYLLREDSDPNSLVYLFKVEDVPRAQAFTETPAAAEAAQESGIIGPFELLYLHD